MLLASFIKHSEPDLDNYRAVFSRGQQTLPRHVRDELQVGQMRRPRAPRARPTARPRASPRTTQAVASLLSSRPAPHIQMPRLCYRRGVALRQDHR